MAPAPSSLTVPYHMESFGEYLKTLREEKGKSLQEIAESTKIASSNLEFLEQDRYDLLPPRVFVKGFIRSYVEDLGLDPEEALQRFEAFSKEGEMPDYETEESPVFLHPADSRKSFVGNPWFTVILSFAGLLSLGILLLTGVSRLAWWEGGSKAETKAEITGQPSEKGSTGPWNRSEQGAEGTAVSSDTKKNGKISLEVTALASTWVRVQPDTGRAEESMMSPGDVQIYTARKGFYLQTGNAAGIRLRIDGKELPPLGVANQPVARSLP